MHDSSSAACRQYRSRESTIRIITLAAALLLFLAGPASGFAGGQSPVDDGKLSVFVSIMPQAYFVERVGADRVRVEVLVKPGQDPHTFEPTPQQMARLAEAEVFFRIGVEFENSLMPRIQSIMKGLEVVDCRKGIRLRQMKNHGHDEEHGEKEPAGDGHEAGGHGDYREGSDPHVWLSVSNAIQISATIHEALVRIDPGRKELYDRGYRELVADLEALDRRIAEILAPVRGKPLFVFHPAFGYFAEDYGLQQIAVETGGAEPSARQLAGLIDRAKEEGVKVIFVQPQFSQASAQTIAAEIGGAVVPIDSLAPNYVENLEQMAHTVEEALR
jgi:zinc transport system substrate-binding protein